MNCKTRGEKLNEAIETIICKVRTAVEIAVILGGIVAIGLIVNMNRQITILENQLTEMEQQNQEEDEERLIIKDAVTGRVIYDQPR